MVSPDRKSTVSPGRRSGFTLVELLVVISIIALLIAILLPSLSKAREQAKTVVCASRIKGILGGMSVYATEHKDYIVGSPSTSGSMLLGERAATDPASLMEAWDIDPVQLWDWGGGMAGSMSMKLSTRPHEIRFKEIIKMKAFKCPSNKVLAEPYTLSGGEDLGILPMVSYNTSRNFMWPGKKDLLSGCFPDPIGGFGGADPHWNVSGAGYLWGWISRGGQKRHTPGNWAEASEESFIPVLDRVGTPAGKVFVADGARYVEGTDEPSYNAYPWATFGGAFSDVGPYSRYSRAWNRIAGFPEEAGPSDATDVRVFSYRHGKKQGYLPLGNYKMNVGFFDNHVETMNDVESANPHMWLPRGFRLYNDPGDLHPDIIETYFGDGTTDYIEIR